MSGARFPSPFRQGREEAELTLADEKRRQESLEDELAAVRKQLELVRSNLGGGGGTAPSTPTPYGAAQYTPSYAALSSGMNAGAPSSSRAAAGSAGVEAYYIERLRKLLGAKADIHNLLEHPGVTIEEAFGAVLASLPGDGAVPWIVTDDRWTHDLHKSHYHNVLKTASEPGKEINVNLLVLTAPGAAAGSSEGKKDAALYAMTYGSAYVAAVSHRMDNTRLVATLKAASEHAGPSVVTAPATADMLSAMQNTTELPIHYSYDPTQPPGARLDVAADSKKDIISAKFIEGEENMSLLMKQLEEPAEPVSTPSNPHHNSIHSPGMFLKQTRVVTERGARAGEGHGGYYR